MMISEQLLATKLYAPPLHTGLVARPRLVQRLNQGLQMGSQVTLVSAPAGYGKTTLVLEWLQELDRPFTWLSLDRADNHPVQFFTYLVAALQKIDASLGDPFSDRAAGLEDQEEGWVQWLPPLINRLSALTRPFVLVLDDYHTITDLSINQGVSELIERLPPLAHLILTTRQDPLLPISRLRSRGQITEIRQGDLRFTPEEAESFLNGTMRLDLFSEQVKALATRTEGWITGLQLAALSLSEGSAWSEEPADPGYRQKFIDSFAGDDRHVVDYLMDEILSRQPKPIQRFLLQTSILGRLCGPLCDAVLDGAGDGVIEELKDEGSSFNLHPSAAILENLERANLFIIPLDNRRKWYRYHNLFADLLNSRLQSSSAELVPALHSRASQWFESQELTGDAIDHALLADDFDRALRLIEGKASRSIWASGELPKLLNWSRRLPADALLARPRLCLYYARGLFFTGQVEAAQHYLHAAEKALQARDPSDPATAELLGVLYTNQATFAAMAGDSQSALELAARAKPLIPAWDTSTHARVDHALGMAELLRGEPVAAQVAFSEAIALCRKAGNQILGLDVSGCLAQALLLSGCMLQAEQVCTEALTPESRQAPAASAVYLALAEIKFERYELRQAHETLDLCLELAKKAGWPHVLWQATTLQALVEGATGDRERAQETIRKAEAVANGYGIPHVARLVSACQARVQAEAGELEAASRWASGYQRQPPPPGCRDFEELTLAQIFFALGQLQAARTRLEELIVQTVPVGRVHTSLQALALLSRIHDTCGEVQASQEVLQRALELAGPEPFVRAFLPARNQPTRDPALQETTHRRLEQIFMTKDPTSLPGRSRTGGSAPLVEPLSERELEVLCLISEGFSNPEIAARLYLSVNTLRAHAANIYRKLDVHNRVQAVSRGRELGLLPEG